MPENDVHKNPLRQKLNPPLLDVLLSLKPNVVYTMASPKEITAAAALFVKGAVASFQWGESGRVLQVRLSSEGKPTLLFTSEDGKLQASALPESANTKLHVLTSVMTILRVLLGAKFHREDLPSAVVEKFRRQLKAPTEEIARPKVLLTSKAFGEAFDLDYDSGLREASWRTSDPIPEMEWLHWQAREPERVAEGFCRWLANKPGKVDIEVRAGDNLLVASDAKAATMHGRTQLDVRDDQITIRRILLDGSGASLVTFIDLGYGLAFLPKEKVFAQIQPPGAWSEFTKLGAVRPCDSFLQAPADRFFAAFPEAVASTCDLLGGKGTPVKPIETGCSGLLDAVTDGHLVRVRLRVKTDAGHDVPAHHFLARLFGNLFLDGPFALLVKGFGRRRRIAERLAETVMLDSDEALERHFLETSDDPSFTSRHMHGEDASKCLRLLFGQLRNLDAPHLTSDPSQTQAGNPWLVCTGAGAALSHALAAFIKVFPGEDPLRAKNLVFDIDGLRFFESLPALLAACQKHCVGLLVDEKDTKIEKLAFSVRILRGGQIDWFELHPEARAGSLTIPRAQWDQVLRAGHYRDDDGTLVTLDAASLALLRRLNGLIGKDESGESVRRPRLQLFEWIALRKEGIPCELPPEDDAVLQSLLNLETIASHPLPPGLRAELRDYQHHGYDWLCFLYRHRFGACLADDMGLGKTLQAIAFLAALKDGTLARQEPTSSAPHLVVLPSTLLFNWQSEIEKFFPALKVHEYTGQSRSLDFGSADIVMTTYGLVHRDIEALAQVQFDVAIFDEAQAIKNATSARARAAADINARFRLCLTGTPMENHIGEFHSIMETAVPGLFGDRKAFLRDYESALPVLDRVRPFLLRRTKEMILSELPPKVESDAYFALSEPQRECYTRAVGEVRKEVLAAYQDRPSQQAGIVALAALMRLRQICIAPSMLSDQFDTGSPKIEFLTEQLAELADEGHAALVFSQFLKALDLTAAALESAGLPFLRMDGSTPSAERKKLVQSFQSGSSPGIFLISLKTGGTGLNLTRASYVYHLDPWWNPAVENQASDRVHRIGQKRSVFVHRLIMRHTVEEKMMTLKQKKQALFNSVLEKSGTITPDGAASLTASDFKFLIDG